jgi:hypothetical protein
MKLPPPGSTLNISSINLTDCLLSITAILHPFANLTLVHYHLQCSPSFSSLSCQLYEHYCSNGIIFIPLSLTQSYLCSTKFCHKFTQSLIHDHHYHTLSCQLDEHYCSTGTIFISLSSTQSYLCSTNFCYYPPNHPTCSSYSFIHLTLLI